MKTKQSLESFATKSVAFELGTKRVEFNIEIVVFLRCVWTDVLTAYMINFYKFKNLNRARSRMKLRFREKSKKKSFSSHQNNFRGVQENKIVGICFAFTLIALYFTTFDLTFAERWLI